MFQKPLHRTTVLALAACGGFALSGAQAFAGHRNASCGGATGYVPYRTTYHEPAYLDTGTYAAPVIDYVEPTYVVPRYAATAHVGYVRYGRRHHRAHHYYYRPHSTHHVYRDHHGYRSHRRGRSLSVRIGDRHRGHRGHRGVSIRYRH